MLCSVVPGCDDSLTPLLPECPLTQFFGEWHCICTVMEWAHRIPVKKGWIFYLQKRVTFCSTMWQREGSSLQSQVSDMGLPLCSTCCQHKAWRRPCWWHLQRDRSASWICWAPTWRLCLWGQQRTGDGGYWVDRSRLKLHKKPSGHLMWRHSPVFPGWLGAQYRQRVTCVLTPGVSL